MNPTPKSKLRTRSFSGALELLQIFSQGLLQLEGNSLDLGVLSQSIFSPGGGRHDSTVEAGQTRREGAAQDVTTLTEGLLQLSSNARHLIAAKGGLGMQGVVAVYPEHTKKEKKEDIGYFGVFSTF